MDFIHGLGIFQIAAGANVEIVQTSIYPSAAQHLKDYRIGNKSHDTENAKTSLSLVTIGVTNIDCDAETVEPEVS